MGPISTKLQHLGQATATNRPRAAQNVLTTRTTRGTFQRPLRTQRATGTTQQNQTPRWL